MKKLLLLAGVAFLLLSCNDGDMEDQDTGPFSLIGTWEAGSEYVLNGNGYTYKSVLTFLNETEYTQEDDYIAMQGTPRHYEDSGTYVREEENIIYTDEYGNKYTGSYKFINKNSLKTSVAGWTHGDLVYERIN